MKRVLTINEWYENMHEAYDGNMSDFRYEYPVKFEEVTGNSEKAIKRISKAGKGYEVRTSTYMSKDELAKVGDAMGLELKSYEKSSSVVVAVYENVNEDWGSSDQSAMNKSIHRDAGSPKQMPSPFDSKLRHAAEDAVDFYWEDWDEYQDDRGGLIDNAVRAYLRSYFPKEWAMMVRMFEGNEVDEKINMDDINDSYGFWGTIESGGIKLAKKVENLFFEAINGLMKNYKMSEEEALKVLNSKMGRKSADQIIDGQADSGLLGLEQYYGKSLKKEMDKVLVMDEARDINDPVLLKMRAAMAKRNAAKNAPKEPAKKEMSPAKVAKLRKLQAERAQIMRDMEQEAEMEGGPTADRYGKMLNKIDKEIAKLGGHGEKESVKEAKMPEPRKDEYYFSVRNSDAKDVWKMADDEFGNDISRGRIEVLFQKNKYVIKDFELAKRFYQYMRDRGVKFFDQNFVSESIEVNEGWSGPFVFNDKMSDDELKSMYDAAIDGYAYHTKGMQYPKSDYKKAYQAIEKILKKRGISVDESAITEARSINKIQKEWNTVSQQMKEMVKSWKESEGNEKKIYLQKLKDLTNKKKDLEKELNIAVKGKDRNTELAASESVEVNEKAEEWVVFLKDGALKMNFHSQHKNQKAAQKELDFLLKNALNTNDNTGMMVRSDWDGAIADGYAFESKDNN